MGPSTLGTSELPGGGPGEWRISNDGISWWLNQPFWKILVKLDHFPNFRGEHAKKCPLKPPPSSGVFSEVALSFQCFFGIKIWAGGVCRSSFRGRKNTTLIPDRVQGFVLRKGFYTPIHSCSFRMGLEENDANFWKKNITIVGGFNPFEKILVKLDHSPR